MGIGATLGRALPGRVAVALAPFAQRGERLCRALQGKGWNGGSVEVEVAAILPLLPLHPATVFDVGANRGDWTRALLRQAGGRIARIIAFEPAAVHQTELEALPSKVLVRREAVSDTTGSALLHGDVPGTQLASLHRRRLDHHGLASVELETVPTARLDDVAAELGVEHIDLLKLDIEGHELHALRGAERLLVEGRVRALTFEFGGCNIDSRTFFQDYWYFLTERGYRVLRLVGGGLLPIARYSEQLETFVTTNYAAVLDPPHARGRAL